MLAARLLAPQLGTEAERSRIAARRTRRAAAFAGLWNQARRIYQALDLGPGKTVDASTSAGSS